MQAKVVRVCETPSTSASDGSALTRDLLPLLTKAIRALVQALFREARAEHEGR